MMMIINRIFALILIVVLGLSGQVQAAQAPAGMDVEDWVYLYDANGNITDRLNSTSFTQFDYDVLNRLTGEMGQEDSSYQYDDVGNRLEKTTESVIESYHYSPTSNRLEQAGSDNRTFDDIGNTVSDRNGQRVFTYNTAGRLHQVHENGVLLATYDYDAHGRRTRKVTPDGVVIYIYGPGGELLGEYDETGQPVREYVHLNGEPLVQIDGMLTEETVTYLHTDHLGTPRRGTDVTGEVVWSWESDAFGATPANDDPDADGHKMVVNLRFPGQYFDKETELHYNWHRDYDPSLGRYIQSDPIGLAGGLNTYVYVESNPLIYIDPLGLRGIPGQTAGGLRPGTLPGMPGQSCLLCSTNDLFPALGPTDLPDNVVPFPQKDKQRDKQEFPSPDQCSEGDDDVDCSEWLELLQLQYSALKKFKDAGGDTRMAELQHNRSVMQFCKDPDCGYLCAQAPRF